MSKKKKVIKVTDSKKYRILTGASGGTKIIVRKMVAFEPFRFEHQYMIVLQCIS